MSSIPTKMPFIEKILTWPTFWTIDTFSQERLFIAFMYSVDMLIEMDPSDYADRMATTYEWTAQVCWEKMSGDYKDQILAAIPDIECYLKWETIPETYGQFSDVFNNVFKRVTPDMIQEIEERTQAAF